MGSSPSCPVGLDSPQGLPGQLSLLGWAQVVGLLWSFGISPHPGEDRAGKIRQAAHSPISPMLSFNLPGGAENREEAGEDGVSHVPESRPVGRRAGGAGAAAGRERGPAGRAGAAGDRATGNRPGRAGPVETELYGPIEDQSSLHGLLDRIQSLGLELVEIRQLPPAGETPTVEPERPP